MLNKGLKRIIVICGLGTVNGPDDKPLYESKEFPQQYVQLAKDHYNSF